MRGTVVMKGYFKMRHRLNAFAGGWFHSGDLGVVHPDGYVQLKDRSKDIIISGGENISSIEVEDACINIPPWPMLPWLRCRMKNGARRLAPLSKSLMAKTSAKTSCAIGAARILPALKCHEFRFESIPKTSTGKIQKYALRQRIAGGDPD